MLNRYACPDFTPISPDELTGEEMTRPETTYFKDVWRNLKKRKTALASLFVLALLVVMVLAGPMMNEYNYYSNDYAAANQAPSDLHWFGTDTLGRDLWTRVWVGGRVSLLIAILATVIPYAIGMLIGGISGYFGLGGHYHIVSRILACDSGYCIFHGDYGVLGIFSCGVLLFEGLVLTCCQFKFAYIIDDLVKFTFAECTCLFTLFQFAQLSRCLLKFTERHTILLQKGIISAEIIQYLQMLFAVEKYLVVVLTVDIDEHTSYFFEK